jgi:uncharacterized heparinase superfamily protein
VPDLGVWHERVISLSGSGDRITGIDRLIPASGLAAPRAGKAAIRFHLHPDVHVILDGNDNLMLMADHDDSWTFEADGIEPKLSPAYFFAKVTGAQKSKVIVLEFNPAEQVEVHWRLTRTGTGAAR